MATRLRRAVLPRRTDSLNPIVLGREVLGDQRFLAVDVGAANGLLPHWHWLNGVASIMQIEPRAEACRELEAMNAASGYPERYRVVEAALSGIDGPRTLYVSNAPTGTSLLPPAPQSDPDCGRYVDLNYIYPIKEHVIQTKTLATIMREQGEARVDLIKLDIQGAELEALQGLGGPLQGELLGVELEIGMHQFYPPQARFPAVEAFMHEHGLELFDVRVARVHQQRDGRHDYYQREVFSVYDNSPTISARIWELDAVYFRKRSDVLNRGDADLLRRLLIAYMTYNYFAEAYSLVDEAQAHGLLGAEQRTALQQAVVDLHHVRLYRPWLADTAFMRWARAKVYPYAPRSAPRWCQYMYQGYPNG
jgi:FkbM family methyltransferase